MEVNYLSWTGIKQEGQQASFVRIGATRCMPWERSRRPKMSEHFDSHAEYLSYRSSHQLFYHATVENDFDAILRMWPETHHGRLP